MIILSLDTSSAAGSVALVSDGAILDERAGDPSRTHGERLPAELMSLLDQHRIAPHAIDLFAVAIGPGSFTGLRVGIATIQGLALANDRLVAPVTTFEALARCAAGSDDPIATWIDAHRGEVFGALFSSDDRPMITAPSSMPPRETLEAWSECVKNVRRVRFVGDGAVRYHSEIERTLGDRAVIDTTTPPLAGAIGAIAHEQPSRAVRPHAIVPLYVRRPDAELARDRRQ